MSGEVHAVEELHGEEDRARRGLAEVGDVDDVLVADLRGRLGLLHEARDQVGLAREVFRQDLERDLLLDEDVLGEVDDAHAAFAELADDAVAIGDGRAE